LITNTTLPLTRSLEYPRDDVIVDSKVTFDVLSINVQTQVGRIPAQKEKLATPKNIVDFWLIEDNIWQAETKVGE
jgi:hypothetical protein